MAVAVRPPEGPAEPRQYLAGAHEGAENRRRQNPRLARFARFHLGPNGAVHGGALGLLFDSVLGMTSAVLTGARTNAPRTCTSTEAQGLFVLLKPGQP
jgi:hypothetical protein